MPALLKQTSKSERSGRELKSHLTKTGINHFKSVYRFILVKNNSIEIVTGNLGFFFGTVAQNRQLIEINLPMGCFRILPESKQVNGTGKSQTGFFHVFSFFS